MIAIYGFFSRRMMKKMKRMMKKMKKMMMKNLMLKRSDNKRF
jgi:hypothetical protein